LAVGNTVAIGGGLGVRTGTGATSAVHELELPPGVADTSAWR
jgi:hypothetical protein